MNHLRRALVLAIAAAHPVVSQPVIAAKAGLIQYADDEILLNERSVSNARLLAGTRVAPGEIFRTRNGRAEVLLQPGTWLRLAPNTGLRMIADSLAGVKVEITGRVMLDAGTDGAVELTCGSSVISIAHRGMYRLNCGEPPLDHALRVYRGRASVAGEGRERKVTDRQVLALGPGGQQAHLERNDLDEFDRWSAQRSALAAAKLEPGGKASGTGIDNRTITDSDDIARILYGPWSR